MEAGITVCAGITFHAGILACAGIPGDSHWHRRRRSRVTDQVHGQPGQCGSAIKSVSFPPARARGRRGNGKRHGMHRLRRGGQRGEALPRFGPGTGGRRLDNPQDNRSDCCREGQSLRLGQ
ncbi:hypothetical protein GCM10009712_16660 [Pseudarthrobacter sulfonivorans]